MSRQGQHHASALAYSALHVHAAVVQLGNALHNRQSQAFAPFAAGGGDAVAALIEPVKKMGDVLVGNQRICSIVCYIKIAIMTLVLNDPASLSADAGR